MRTSQYIALSCRQVSELLSGTYRPIHSIAIAAIVADLAAAEKVFSASALELPLVGRAGPCMELQAFTPTARIARCGTMGASQTVPDRMRW